MNQNNMNNNMMMMNQNNMNNAGIMNAMINSMNQMNNMMMTMIYQNLQNNANNCNNNNLNNNNNNFNNNNNNFNNQVNQTNDNNNDEDNCDLDDKLTIIFKTNKKDGSLDFVIKIVCKEDELVEDIINRYCFKTNQKKENLLFLYNSKKLVENQTILEAKLNSGSIIFVVIFGNTYGAKSLF